MLAFWVVMGVWMDCGDIAILLMMLKVETWLLMLGAWSLLYFRNVLSRIATCDINLIELS